MVRVVYNSKTTGKKSNQTWLIQGSYEEYLCGS